MQQTDAELATEWRARPTVDGDFIKGPDRPAGYTFFGKLVYRTPVLARVSSAITTVSVTGFGGISDLVDVWGGAFGNLTGSIQGFLNVGGWINAGWNGAAGIRVRIDPTIGILEIVSGSILEFGGASEGIAFPSADIEIIVFWTK